MITLVCKAPGQLEYMDMRKPQTRKGFSLLKIKRIGICGTDLHAYEGTQPYFSYPRILGHELSAEYIDGDAEGFLPGEAVTFIPYFNCGECIACRTGTPNCCVKMQVCGVHQHGGMVEFLNVPSNSLLHGEGLSYDELALIEPLAIGAHAIRRAAVKKGESVLVIGAGPIGLGIIEFSGIENANVIVLDINQNRLSFVKEKLAFPHIIDGSNDNILKRLHKLTGGDMPSVVIDATGNLNAINKGFAYMAHGGRYVLVGLQKEDIAICHPEFHKKEATLMSSRNATREDFIHVIKSMKKGKLIGTNYITHSVLFNEIKQNFSKWINPQSGVVKAMATIP